MRKSLLYITLLLAIGLFSCEKQKQISTRELLSGPKLLDHYQWIKQDSLGNFSKTIWDTTNLAKIILWDNGSEAFNNATYDGNFAPVGWFYSNVGVGVPRLPIGWYADYEEMKSITFWSEESLGGKSRVTYALDFNRLTGNMHLEAVYYIDGVAYKEVLELKDL